MSDHAPRVGILETTDKGFGFLRDPANGYRPSAGDPYFSRDLIRKLGLKEGQVLEVETGPPAGGKRKGGPRVTSVVTVHGQSVEAARQWKPFKSLTSISPDRRLHLETETGSLSMRLVDLIAPIGMGTRGLIVAPPRTGKTTLLKEMALAVAANHPEVYIMALLVDERPEEVTDMRRSIHGEVVASSMDERPADQRRLARLMAASARCRVEAGQDVFLILDSITRLARAFNSAGSSSGRTMSGGLDSRAMEIPRQIFGSARATEEAGSLTIIGTALVDTGSRMDELIFHEFKGTGNMELVLDRKLADLRIWPAVNIAESGTRREELLFSEDEGQGVNRMRRALANLAPIQAAEKMIKTLGRHDDNSALLQAVAKV